MALVEDHHRLLVLLAVGRPRRLVTVERLLHRRRQECAQAVAFADPQLEGGRRVGDHEGAQPGWVLERMLHTQHAAPRLAKDVVTPRDPEVFDERRDSPRNSSTVQKSTGASGKCWERPQPIWSYSTHGRPAVRARSATGSR